MHTYIPEFVKIKEIFQETPDIITLRLDYQIEHQPGQFVMLSLTGIGEAPFGIASFSDKHIDLTIKNVGSLTNLIHKLKKGDTVGIRGPFGKGYPMFYMKDNSVIIIGGGTGTAPLRSVMQYLIKHRENYQDIDLFLGFRNPEEILYKRDLKEWEEHFNINLTVDKADKKWKGHIGVVTNLLEESKLNNYKKTVATCGPPIMIKFVIQKLQSLGFNDDQIYVSLERYMQCGIGKCGHCMVGGKFICENGPVFNYIQAKWLED